LGDEGWNRGIHALSGFRSPASVGNTAGNASR
jgi:hypothetical protein